MTRRGFMDVFVEDIIVRIVLDISGMNPEDIYLGLSLKTNCFIVKYTVTNVVLEIPLPVVVKDDFKWSINNGILEVEIQR